ncbi:His-Xaa-Ser system radical SAM maturase HxsB [Methylovulum psychrotolerans]|uniref:Anaerobic sulfatase-maturating enzyme n=1 Tax=Methylovulum psychrotolerans TaxID=1704499 RepID=A0A2S5CIY0_9GAMM|nr:His-Xaa-Ser system radical SAM maturase HxsB [Methylovulum psychrotolerans]POZ50702.1 Anaerobic sulfatase-maturating enzyme [Methylovulum psychrotolerans]
MPVLGKKFRPPEAFDQAINGYYQLLPSRFVRLDGKRYLLSNDVGEFLVVGRGQLADYIQKKVPKGSDFYHDLKSKCFLVDGDSNVALDLLALKYRTKARRISQFTALHIFVVSLRCDYTCRYCQVSRQTDDKHAFDMSEATADKALGLVFKSPSPTIKIEFQGGEPLLNFSLIRYIVANATAENIRHKKNLQFVITTNLSLLTDEMLSFCSSHGIFLSTSLDGPEQLHNANRPRPGMDGHKLTVEGIKKAQTALGRDKIGALMTTTEKSLPAARAIIDAYLENGLDSIFLRPLSPYGFAVKTRQAYKYDVDRWFEFYKEGLDYILEINRQGHRFVELYTELVVNKLLSPFSTGYVDLQSPSGAGISAIVYNYDGDVYASDEARMLAEMGDKAFRLGNVHDDGYEDIMLSDTLLDMLESTLSESIPMCTDCGFLPYCGTDPVYHHATQGDMVGNKALSGFCGKNMKIFRHVVLLLEDDPEARETLLGWVRP